MSSVADLEKNLLKKSRKNCTLEDTTTILKKSGRYAGYAPLQMAQYQQQKVSYSPGDRKMREEVLKAHENTSSDNLKPEEFFERSKQVVCNSVDYKSTLNAQAKKEVLDKLSNVVGVIGEAGVGKSTLTKVLLNRIVGKEKLYKVDLVFYAKLGDFNDEGELNLLEFLMG